MPSEVRYSPLALDDLDSIWKYISSELASPYAANETVGGILERVKLLATFPDSGTPLSSVTKYVGAGYRFVRSGNYLVFYRHEDAVYIDRILNARQNWLHILFED
ncbi:type II toxin-antitoxin system RelE/ParE family toxin [uncultured Parolsenella sp.]|uniref:type II toxin-antitoxin system RelE/ParE family toxin n=1 Tax=uncultured Parolsenella sp. TaxID=2083008 RepID=UPI0025E50B08|nr:type II toxin-antitoxin system RelE/ParE family toxin [uncultured Parolsenella sp.]